MRSGVAHLLVVELAPDPRAALPVLCCDPEMLVTCATYLATIRKSKRCASPRTRLNSAGSKNSRRDCPEYAEHAEGYYRDLLALAEELGMRPLVAHSHFGLGKLYRRTGRREQAQAHLTTATSMCREMEMTYWLEQAEAQVN